MHAKYEVSISYGSKVKVKVNLYNGQTNGETMAIKDVFIMFVSQYWKLSAGT